MIDNIMFFMDTETGLERLEKMGERVAKLRDRLTEERGSKYSQQNLADDANAAGFGLTIGQPQIGNIESKKMKALPSLHLLAAMAKALGTSSDYLLGLTKK